MRPQSWGQRGGDVRRVRREVRGRVLHQLVPSPGSPLAGSARRPHPLSREPPGNACSQGGGDTRASQALRSPLSPRPFQLAYLRYGCPATAPEVPAGAWCGAPGALSRRPPHTKPGADGGRAPPPAGTGGRSGQSEIASERPTSPGDVAMTLTPPSPRSGREFCPGESTPSLHQTPSSEPVVAVTSLPFLLPRLRTHLFDLPASSLSSYQSILHLLARLTVPK